MKQITPLPPQKDKPIDSSPELPESGMEPLSETPPSALEPELSFPPNAEPQAVIPFEDPDTVLEGQFENVPPEDIIPTEAPEKSKPKPAIFALFTVLALIALCCLMSIIVYFMVRPAMLESRTVGALFPAMNDLLSIFK